MPDETKKQELDQNRPHVTTKVLFFLRREPAHNQYIGISASVTEKSRKASDT